MTAEEAAGGRRATAEPAPEAGSDEVEIAVEEVVAEPAESESESESEHEAEPAEAEPAEAEPDYKDMYLRALAESENTRKRARRDVEQANARGVAKLARELLPSLDNLDRALAAAEAQEGDPDHHLTSGIRLVQKELLTALERVGIEPFSPEGERFDPHQHEAVSQVPAEGAESGTIKQVYQQGYRYKEEILRPARVVVAE